MKNGTPIRLLILLTAAMPAMAADVEQATHGYCSPAQNGNGNTVVCNGADPRAMKRLMDDLDQVNVALAQKTREVNELAHEYAELKKQQASSYGINANQRAEIAASLKSELEKAQRDSEEMKKRHEQLMEIIRRITAFQNPSKSYSG